MIKFKVKKNKKFFSGPRWNFFEINKKRFDIKVCFRENCLYQLSENYNQINKLFGYSFKLLPWYDKFEKKIKPGHHKDSVRFGWRCIDGENIEIVSYIYIDGGVDYKPMLKVKTDEWTHLRFLEVDEYYVFVVITEEGETMLSKFRKRKTNNGIFGLFIHKLFPYFGGKIPAPHEMRIDLIYEK